jgi:hypothetical protein
MIGGNGHGIGVHDRRRRRQQRRRRRFIHIGSSIQYSS